MEVTIEKDYDFVPKWNDNDKDANPAVFHMRHLTTAERDKLLDYSVDADGKPVMHVDRQGLFMRAVKKIDRLTVNGELVKDAKDFLEKPDLDQLFSEIIGNIVAKNGKTDLKNS